MKLTDENGKEYKVISQDLPAYNYENKDYGCFIVKPIDEWPKAGDKCWYIEGDGDVYQMSWTQYSAESNYFIGVYKTREEGELARDRIQSLQEATSVDAEIDDTEEKTIYVSFVLPKKYLKAWKDLSDE